MRKFTLFIAFIAISSFVFGQMVNQSNFSKGKAKVSKNTVLRKINHSVKNTKAAGAVIWSDNFTTAANWTLTHATGTTADWVIGSSSMTTNMWGYMGNFNYGQGKVAYIDGITSLINAGGSGTVDLIDAYCETTNPIDLTLYTGVTLKFYQNYKAFNSDSSTVEFSTDGGATWPYKIVVNQGIIVNNWGLDSVSTLVSQFIGGQSNVKIRFHWFTTDTDPQYGCGYGWAIDNVQLIESYVNELEITEIIPGFDYTNGGTYQYFPASNPTRIFNSAVIQNNGSANQPNTILTVNINDATTPYSGSSATGYTYNSGSHGDTIDVGATIGDPFYLNCIDFTSPVTPSGTINAPYTINYILSSDSTDEVPVNNVDSFAFNVGYVGNPYSAYTNGPDLQYTFARNNQNPMNSDISPADWSGGGTSGDGIYTSFVIWDEAAALGTEIRNIDVFISNSCTFDISSGMGANITGIIYKWDSGSSSWIQQIASNPIDLYSYDTLTWKNIPLLVNGTDEFLTPGEYCAGIEIVYNTYECYIGCDRTSLQAYTATYWNFPGSTNPGIRLLSNFKDSPMINVNVYSNSVSAKLNNNDTKVRVYPNPSNGLINVNAPENSTIKVYNLLGINVATVENSSTFNTIDLSALPNGNYIVKVISGNNTTTKKVNLIK